METYCILQARLGQALDPDVLEASAAATASITRMDCPRILREISGIMVSGLEHADALAFQAALASRGYPTHVVAEAELPVLHASRQIQRLELADGTLSLTDSMGRENSLPVTALVFLAAAMHGRVDRRHPAAGAESHGEGMPFAARTTTEQNEMIFRCDLFFSEDPHRLHLGLAKDTVIFHQGRPVRLRHPEEVHDFMTAVAAILPADRLSLQLRQPDTTIFYKNIHTYENEIRWHFHRFMKADGG